MVSNFEILFINFAPADHQPPQRAGGDDRSVTALICGAAISVRATTTGFAILDIVSSLAYPAAKAG
jgi:hypothetical protein